MASPEPLDLRATLARIDRDRAETEKLLAETRSAEALKLSLDRWLAPLIALATLVGAIGISRLFGH